MRVDLYDEGYGAGFMGCDWLATVLGRFLRQWERKELAAGWRDGLDARDEAEREINRCEEFNAVVEVERVGVEGDGEIPW